MGSNLLIMRGRYSGREYFASQICHLASSKGSANPIWNRQIGCPEARPTASPDKNSLHCLTEVST
jgi:hypothetical protein